MISVVTGSNGAVFMCGDRLRAVEYRELGLALALIVLCAGCAARQLMPTPNLYLDAKTNPFASVPESRRTPDVVVPFATDRLPERDKTGALHFGHRRGDRLIVGSCRVSFGEGLSWEQLVDDSTSSSRLFALQLSLHDLHLGATYPETPFALNLIRDAEYSRLAYEGEARRAREALHIGLREEIERVDQHDVVLFIHGYNNSFEDAVYLTAQFWHFLGRRGIPIAYTWPAGRGGLFGYTADTESGDFTIFHLKTFLRDLAASPDVNKIHILSHSRGTDVLMSALRELKLATAAGGEDPKAALKLGHLIMAAPDIDTQVFAQRFLAEEINTMADDLTIYLSGKDRALLLSKWLHSSVNRLGLLTPGKIPEGADRLLGYYGNLHLINANVSTNFIGHDFFYTNPAVSSDLILLLKHGRDPGAENGRPLRPIMPHFWSIDRAYPDVDKFLMILPKPHQAPKEVAP
ncbi:MAG: alpha/beta hydrolase [FCB group bacterium]|nr:alpha/beta hydrolase [FCB group bacterium]